MTRENIGRSCRTAIKKTLAYSLIFKYPMSFYQLSNSLITAKQIPGHLLKKELSKLLKLGVIQEKDNTYFLHNSKPVDQQKRKDTTKKLLSENQKIVKNISKIPWVKMVAVTGSAAAYNADEDADLDILIVTSKNRLWISRFFVASLLKIFSKYPKTDGEAGKICANIYLEEDHLEWTKSKQNVYTSQEIVRMQPVFIKDNMYLRFLKANKWIKRHVANFGFYEIKKIIRNDPDSILLNFIENIFMKIQYSHMLKKITTENIGKYFIHFNKNDNSKKIMNQFTKFKYSPEN